MHRQHGQKTKGDGIKRANSNGGKWSVKQEQCFGKFEYLNAWGIRLRTCFLNAATQALPIRDAYSSFSQQTGRAELVVCGPDS